MDLKDLLKLTQEELLDYCYLALNERGYDDDSIDYTEDYLFAEGNIPVLLVAHCDIVHKKTPEIIVEDKEQGILWSPTGIGGDDRCGVYAILKICETYNPSVLFTTNEETGGLGAKKFAQDYEGIGVNFIIEIDRRGDKQVVYYQCGNEEFMKFIEGFGFTRQTGSYSDVSTLSTKFDVAGCNLSAGYYNEHRETEYICMSHLWHTIRRVKKILSLGKDLKEYDCQEKKTTYNYGSYGKRWADYYDYDYDGYGWYDRESGLYFGTYAEFMEQKKKNKEKLEKINKEIEEDYKAYYEKCKKEKEENAKVAHEILEIEDDYYTMTKEEFKKKYGKDKPDSVIDIYDIQEEIEKTKVESKP